MPGSNISATIPLVSGVALSLTVRQLKRAWRSLLPRRKTHGAMRNSNARRLSAITFWMSKSNSGRLHESISSRWRRRHDDGCGRSSRCSDEGPVST